MKKTKAPAQQLITIPIAEALSEPGTRRVTEEELKRMKSIHPLFKSIVAALGERVQLPVLVDGALHVYVLADESTAPYSLGAFAADLVEAADQLHRNAGLSDPLPHAQAVKKPHLVAVLKAAVAANADHNLRSTLHTEVGPCSLPILEPMDFTQPDIGESNFQVSTLRINGLRRDDENGHRLLVGNNDVQVVLPKGDPRWIWKHIRDVLDVVSHLEGRLVRKHKGDPWMPDADCKLVKQTTLIGEPITL